MAPTVARNIISSIIKSGAIIPLLAKFNKQWLPVSGASTTAFADLFLIFSHLMQSKVVIDVFYYLLRLKNL